jgi:hypothetical protein
MFINLIKNTNLFTILTKVLIIILPFYVIIKVYFDKELWMSFFGFFIKELIVILLFWTLIYEYFFNKKNVEIELKFDVLDYLIFAFIWYWILITIFNWLWLSNLFYWGRYDFLWFVVFLIFKHWKMFLKENTKNLIKLFLLYWWISLFLWIVVKFILWEEILSLFWFTIHVSEFWFWWGIPIYQWVEASWIRRFQWILDGPLAMWYFLLLFTWLFASINKKNIDFWVILWLFILLIFIFLTYSRAAMLWISVWGIILFVLNFKYILKYFKKIFIISVIGIIILIWILWYVFQDKIHNVFLRDGSTSWHITRMLTWVDRFIEKPLGSGLATSGPAYRNVFLEKTSLDSDRYYIPESWFVQVLVEWWFIYFWLFILILLNILFDLYKSNNKYIFVMFIWILIMNLFLHIFEATYITILLFLFLALFYRGQNLQKSK